MYIISKEFHFSASHQLKNLPATHPCARLHGHNYIVIIELKANELNDNNFVQDYKELSDLKTYIDENLDHRHLNDVFNSNKVTSEFLAKHLYDWCKKRYPLIYSIKISETPKTWASYTKDS